MKCCFCDEYKNPAQSQFYNVIGRKAGYLSRILLETENWYVVPTLGCLTVGYVLLVCKQHVLSLANLEEESYYEMLSLKANVESILFNQLGVRCIAFEHGAPNAFIKGANSVDHVHLHVIPYARPIWKDIEQTISGTRFENVKDYQALFTRWINNRPDSYLLFQDVDQRIYYASDATGMPSQLFRKCLAPHLGKEYWDWKSEYYIDNTIRTIELFKSAQSTATAFS